MMDRGDTFFWEHHGNKAVRAGKWKLVSRVDIQNRKEGTWELYDMKNDRTETMDFSKIYPEKVGSLQYLYIHWAAKTNVVTYFKLLEERERKNI